MFCHPDVETYDFTADVDYDNDGTIEGYQTEILGLADSLGTLLNAWGVLDGDEPVEGTIADQHLAGALFNFLIFEEDRSDGVHNFKYVRSLLEASIDYVSGLGAPAPADIAALASH